MTICTIRQLGDPVLRQATCPVTSFDDSLGQLVDDLRDTLHAFQAKHGTGRGIAAPQIGVGLRTVYLEFSGQPYVLINPQFSKRSSQMFTVWDSCFSYFGISFQVERHYQVTVCFQDAAGGHHELEAENGLAELLQHELEHLDGILAIDQLVPAGLIMEQSEFLKR